MTRVLLGLPLATVVVVQRANADIFVIFVFCREQEGAMINELWATSKLRARDKES